MGSILSRQAWLKALPVPAATSPALQTLPRTRRKAAGAAQRSRSKLARVAVLYDPAVPGTVREVKEVLPVAARALGLTVQPWEVRACGRFREGIRCAEQAASGWTLRARGPANAC